MSRRAALAATHDMLRERAEKAHYRWRAVMHCDHDHRYDVARHRYIDAAATLAEFELILAEHT